MLLKDSSKEKYDIIIQAGQSNSDGTAFGNVENEYQPNDRVWYLTGDWRFSEDFYFEIAREYAQNNTVRGNFSLSFAKRYINDGRLAADRKLLILRTAAGGTGFLDGHWKTTDWLYNRMMLMLQTSMELNPENRLIALLWHQGETDAVYHIPFDYEHHIGNGGVVYRTGHGSYDGGVLNSHGVTGRIAHTGHVAACHGSCNQTLGSGTGLGGYFLPAADGHGKAQLVGVHLFPCQGGLVTEGGQIPVGSGRNGHGLDTDSTVGVVDDLAVGGSHHGTVIGHSQRQSSRNGDVQLGGRDFSAVTAQTVVGGGQVDGGTAGTATLADFSGRYGNGSGAEHTGGESERDEFGSEVGHRKKLLFG
ncbi:MAG: hypothetical protein IKY52_11005 [Clostridia bacterium]|nr:hypothetical protein [Clostridia bacterium]